MILAQPSVGFGRGRPVAAGYPAWRPAAGEFVDLGGGTLFGARPSGWPTGANAGPQGNWSSPRWNPDFGTMGGLQLHGSGHLSTGDPTWAGAWAWDAATFDVVGRCVPGAPILEGGSVNGYYESQEAATLGHPYPPHGYSGGSLVQSTANGGGPDGSLVRVFFAGAGIANPRSVHQFDMSSASGVPVRVVDDVTIGGSSSSYPSACVDEERGGIWVLSYNGNGPLTFISFADWSLTPQTGVAYNTYGDQTLIKLPPPFDAILACGRANSDSSIWDYRMTILAPGAVTSSTAGAFFDVTVTGTAPAESKNAASWFQSIGKLVAPPNDGSLDFFKMTIPATRAELTSGSYSWATETLTAVGADTWPVRDGIAAGSGLYGGGVVEALSLGVGLAWTGINNTVRAFRLAGM